MDGDQQQVLLKDVDLTEGKDGERRGGGKVVKGEIRDVNTILFCYTSGHEYVR